MVLPVSSLGRTRGHSASYGRPALGWRSVRIQCSGYYVQPSGEGTARATEEDKGAPARLPSGAAPRCPEGPDRPHWASGRHCSSHRGPLPGVPLPISCRKGDPGAVPSQGEHPVFRAAGAGLGGCQEGPQSRSEPRLARHPLPLPAACTGGTRRVPGLQRRRRGAWAPRLTWRACPCDTSLKPTLSEPAARAGHTSVRKAPGPGTPGTNLTHTSPHGHSEVTAPLPPGSPRKKPSRGHGQGGAEAGDSLLPSFPDHCDPLTVFRPRNVLDLPSERLVLVLQEVLLLRGVPDPQLPRHVCRHNGGGGGGARHQGSRATWAPGCLGGGTCL